MIKSKVVAIIPARAGSKRIVGKNKKMLGDKPLICWTIDEAIGCEFIDYIVITTDDLDIWGFSQIRYKDKRMRFIKRPKELAQDDSSTMDVCKHALDELYKNELSDTPASYVDIILLQPTSPFRSKVDISNTYFLIYKNKYGLGMPLVSVYYEEGSHEMKLNGALYMFTGHRLYNSLPLITGGTKIYPMSKYHSVDIDTMKDWRYAENLIKSGKNK